MLNEYLLQKIYDVISNEPGIDTPDLCLEVNQLDVGDQDFRAENLAKILNDRFPETWAETCEHVDKLIETGHIVFADNGCLYPVGYQGELE